MALNLTDNWLFGASGGMLRLLGDVIFQQKFSRMAVVTLGIWRW